MKAEIYINPKNAVKAGANITGHQIINFDPAQLTQVERDELSLCDTDNNGAFRVHVIRSWSCNPSDATTADIDGLKLAIASRIAKRQEMEAEEKAKAAELAAKTDAAMKEWMVLPVTDRIFVSKYPEKFKIRFSGIPYTTGKYDYEIAAEYAKTHPEAAAAIAEAEAEAKRLTAEAAAEHEQVMAENKRKTEEKAAAEKAASERRTAQIAAWVAAKGTQNQKDRHREGLLPEDEVINAIRSAIYAALDGFPRYAKLKNADVCEGSSDYDEAGYHDCDFTVDPAKTLSADEYDRLQEIKKAAPEGTTVKARLHSGKCSECEILESRIGFMVRVKIGEMEFSREYGMDA